MSEYRCPGGELWDRRGAVDITGVCKKKILGVIIFVLVYYCYYFHFQGERNTEILVYYFQILNRYHDRRR